jgi:hypothetical protein
MLRDNYKQRRSRKRPAFEANRIGNSYPTVFEYDEFGAASNAETIRQILNGHIAYYGLGAEQEPTPFSLKMEGGQKADERKKQQRREEEALIARLRATWRALKEP